MRFILSMVIALVGLPLFGQQVNPYQLFSNKGKAVKYKKLVRAAAEADVVFFGELHNDPIAHWLQLELFKSLAENSKLVLGAEMMEADNQPELDAFMSGEVDYTGLDTTARLWNNFKTDYLPVFEFAREQGFRGIATNIPRPYASLVYREGFEALEKLPAEEQAWIAPLPVAYDPELPGYKAMLEMMGGHGGENFPKAQAIKDATMAHFISENLEAESIFYHLNGSYHSDNFEGIIWYLKRLNPDLRILTITTILAEDAESLPQDEKSKADFILVVDEDMTRTY